jgi:hypothetical protein
MLDKKTANVLGAVNEQCKDNNYVIIKNEDITPHLSKKNKLDHDAIKETISYLAEREYIKLKYAEEGTYCLTMLPKGRLFDEEQKEKRYYLREEHIRNLKFMFKVAFVSALFSFLGAAAGYVVVNYFLG